MGEKEEVEATFSHFHQLISGVVPSIVTGAGMGSYIPWEIHKKLEALAQKSGHPLSKIVAWAGEELDRTGK